MVIDRGGVRYISLLRPDCWLANSVGSDTYFSRDLGKVDVKYHG